MVNRVILLSSPLVPGDNTDGDTSGLDPSFPDADPISGDASFNRTSEKLQEYMQRIYEANPTMYCTIRTRMLVNSTLGGLLPFTAQRRKARSSQAFY